MSGRVTLRLFCLPYAGGSAHVFRSWPAALPSDIEVYAVHLPGRERRFREPCYTEARPLAAVLHAELRSSFDRPFALFGHSMGAVLAFELARLLERDGLHPAHLLISGRRAPHQPADDEPIHGLPHDEFVVRLRELDGTPEAVLRDPELMELMLPVLRSDFRLCEAYRYQEGPALSCPISALGGTRDAHVTRDHLLAWRAHTRGGFSMRLFPGGHFFLHEAENAFLEAIAESLLSPQSPMDGIAPETQKGRPCS